jgi:type I restriction enzyme S subunit
MKVNKGFKQTEIGEIPEDWEVVKLIDTVDYIHGKAHEQNIIEFGKYTVVNSKFISSDGKIAKYSNKNIQPALENDVLTVLSDLPNGKALAKCFFVDIDYKYAVNQRVCIWRTKKSSIGKFLYHLLNRYNYFLALNDGVSQTHILNKHIESCLIPLPPLKEQQAIAEVLSDMDRMISQTETLIEKKKAIKQGMMQELLRPKDEWVKVKIKDIGKVGRGRVISQKEIQKSKEIKFPVYSSQTTNDGIMGYLDTYDFDGEYLTWTTDGEKAGTVFYRDGKFNCTNVCGTIKLIGVNAKLIYYMLYIEAPKHVSRNLANPKLMNEPMKNIEVYIPLEVDYQNKIVVYLTNFELQIDTLSKQLQKLKLQKQGMMQVLLTGRIRLT